MEKKKDVLTIFIAGKIEEYRDNKGITQETLSEKIGLSRASLVNIEAGRQSVSIKRLFDIANVLNIEVSDLIPSKKWYLENKDKKIKKIVSFEICD